MKKRIIAGLVAVIIMLSVCPLAVYADEFNANHTKVINKSLIEYFKENPDHKKVVDEYGEHYDDALIWGFDGWSRALLCASISDDLLEATTGNIKKVIESYVYEPSACYAALSYVSSGYIYFFVFRSGERALMLAYIPPTGEALYREYISFDELLKEVKASSITIWEITDEDFDRLNEMSVDLRIDIDKFELDKTNLAYERLLEGFKESNYFKEAAKALGEDNYDNSLAWSFEGWTRALLSSYLGGDLSKTKKALYDSYVKDASNVYVILSASDNQSTYSYYVIFQSGIKALGIVYTPSDDEATYVEYYYFTEQTLETIKNETAYGIWEISDDDINSVNDKFGIE